MSFLHNAAIQRTTGFMGAIVSRFSNLISQPEYTYYLSYYTYSVSMGFFKCFSCCCLCCLSFSAQTESERKKSTVDVFVSVYSAGTTVIEFDPKSYTRTLPENSRQNTQVFTVSAKGPTGISYSIVGGNVDNAFKIESRTGRVTTQGSLNREVLATYKLVVRAETSSPSLAAEVITTIKLSDQNDERPRITFIEDPKEIAIEDYSQTGAFVIKVSSTVQYNTIQPICNLHTCFVIFHCKT